MSKQFVRGDIVECVKVDSTAPDRLNVGDICFVYKVSEDFIYVRPTKLVSYNAEKAGWYPWRFRKIGHCDE